MHIWFWPNPRTCIILHTCTPIHVHTHTHTLIELQGLYLTFVSALTWHCIEESSSPYLRGTLLCCSTWLSIIPWAETLRSSLQTKCLVSHLWTSIRQRWAFSVTAAWNWLLVTLCPASSLRRLRSVQRHDIFMPRVRTTLAHTQWCRRKLRSTGTLWGYKYRNAFPACLRGHPFMTTTRKSA